MLNTRIKELYRLFNRHQKSNFERWLVYELNSKHSELLRLFKGLGKNAGKEKTWMMMHPNAPFHDGNFRKSCQLLADKMEAYIALESFRKDKDAQTIRVVRYLNEEKAANRTRQSLKKAMKSLENRYSNDLNILKKRGGNLRDEHYWRVKYQLLLEWQQYYFQHPEKDFDYGELVKAMDLYLIYKKIFNLLVTHNRNIVKNEANIPGLGADIVDNIPFKTLAREPLLFAFKRMFDFLRGKNGDWTALYAFLMDYHSYLPRDTQTNIFNLLLNIKQAEIMRTAELDPVKDLDELYDFGSDQKLLIVSGYLPPIHFRNILHTKLKIAATLEHESEKSDHFQTIDTLYEEMLMQLPEGQERESTLFGKILINFYRGNYAHLLDLLAFDMPELLVSKAGRDPNNQINIYYPSLSGEAHFREKYPKFSDPYYNLHTRALYLQTRFDLNDPNDLERPIDTFLDYVRKREGISEANKINFEHFSLFFKKLLGAESLDDYTSFMSDLEALPRVYGRYWLKRRIEEKRKKGGRRGPSN